MKSHSSQDREISRLQASSMCTFQPGHFLQARAVKGLKRQFRCLVFVAVLVWALSSANYLPCGLIQKVKGNDTFIIFMHWGLLLGCVWVLGGGGFGDEERGGEGEGLWFIFQEGVSPHCKQSGVVAAMSSWGTPLRSGIVYIQEHPPAGGNGERGGRVGGGVGGGGGGVLL